MEVLDSLGFLFDERVAQAAAQAYNQDRVRTAGGKVENTQSRAYLQMVSYLGSIKGWIVRLEFRSFEDAAAGTPWPHREGLVS